MGLFGKLFKKKNGGIRGGEILFHPSNNSVKIPQPPTSRSDADSNSGLSFAKADIKFQNWQQMSNENVKPLSDVRQQIRDKARNIYLLCVSDDKEHLFKGRKRCLNFKKLENVCDQYNSRLQ